MKQKAVQHVVDRAANKNDEMLINIQTGGAFQKNPVKIRFAKEWFITEKGEIIKLASMLTPNYEVKREILKDMESTKKLKVKKLKTGTKRNHYISIFKIES